MTFDEFQRKAIGVPFLEGGRDYSAWDCWGLCISGHRDVLGIDVPDHKYASPFNYRQIAKLLDKRNTAHWNKIEPAPMAIAMIYRRGAVIHAGLVAPGRKILHVEKGVATCLEPIGNFRIEGFYAPSSCTAPV